MEKLLFFFLRKAHISKAIIMYSQLSSLCTPESERKSSLVRMRRKSPSLLIKDVLCLPEMRKRRKEEAKPTYVKLLAFASSKGTFLVIFLEDIYLLETIQSWILISLSINWNWTSMKESVTRICSLLTKIIFNEALFFHWNFSSP